MSRVCELTGARTHAGNHVSHAVNRTKKRILPNLQTKRIWDESTSSFVTIRATARAIRTLDKKGLRAMRAGK
ncbi:MAG: 50S ribosomal protein L28 [Candidatus Kapaibacterium sp.]